MANPTWQDVLNIAPGDMVAFSDPGVNPLGRIPVAAQNALLGYATTIPDPNTWGTLWFMGVVYLTAHLAKLGLMRGTGPITAESVGSLSVSYAAPKGAGGSVAYAALESTTYGLQYLDLLMSTQAILGLVP